MGGRSRDGEGWRGPGCRDLIAWQKGMDLIDLVYDASEGWPRDELYGLAGQARRAAVSIPANIAAGKGRGTSGDFARFLDIAYGSLCELETLIFAAQRRRFINEGTRNKLIDHTTEIARLIHGLKRSLNRPGGIREDEPVYEADIAEPLTPNA